MRAAVSAWIHPCGEFDAVLNFDQTVWAPAGFSSIRPTLPKITSTLPLPTID